MKNIILFASIVSLSLLFGCQSKSVVSTSGSSAQSRANDFEANLTQTEAMERSKVVSNVHYNLDIVIGETAETFSGKVLVSFDLSQPAQGLFLDFKNGGTVTQMVLNGQVVTAPEFKMHRISLAQNQLKSGTNVAEISYTQFYSHDGRGLHRFQDPEDHKVYLYSQFETYDAHHVFPCFDQPDLKAVLVMKVTAPKAWSVVSTTREIGKVSSGENLIWNFPETPRLSTYLFSLHAGPYHKWESNAGKIPMRLFAREALAKYVDAPGWFKVTEQGLKFYGNYFSFPYPFKKYDQLLVPDFDAGAMENAAAVTFSERYIHRSKETREERERMASVVLHEMAHMWFGDLVTMKWWTGLWLNESFAEFMSAFSSEQATEFKEAWISFGAGPRATKPWAYWEDQLVTTHPIDGDVVDTNAAGTIFDGITYGKGASVLKQLNFYLGKDVFREGVRYYFKQNAYSNTQLQDFVGALEHASHKDLSGWSQSWLKTAGLDSLSADFECSNGKISRFDLVLKGPDGKTSPRTHRTLVALFSYSGHALKSYQTENVEYSGDRTSVPTFIGKACPQMVYPNDQDFDYVKVRLDQRSLATIRSQLKNVQPLFARILIWPNLFQMMQDADLTADDFLQTVESNLPAETELKIAAQLADNLIDAYYYLPNTTQANRDRYQDWNSKFEGILWQSILSAKPGSDWQKQAVDWFTRVATTQGGADHLVQLLDGSAGIKGFNLDTDRRWNAVIRLSALADSRVVSILNKQKASDASDRGAEMVLATDAIRPNLEVKRTWFHRVADHEDMSFERERAAIAHAFPNSQVDLRAELSDDFYAYVPRLAKTRETEFLHLFTHAFTPLNCTQGNNTRLAQFIGSHPDLPPGVLKTLKIDHQEDGRCILARAKAQH